jgi:hypothetical protein
MGDMRPVEPNRLKHEPRVVENTLDLRLEGDSGRMVERLGVPAALTGQLDTAIHLITCE